MSEGARISDWSYLAYLLLRWSSGALDLDNKLRERLVDSGEANFEHLIKKHLESIWIRACKLNHPLQRIYQKSWTIQKEALRELAEEFDRDGVRYIIFKGAEIVERHFDSMNLSSIHDIDILVDEDNIQKCKRALFRLGYAQAYFDLDNCALRDLPHSEIAEHEYHHPYEIYAFSRLSEFEVDPQESEISNLWRRKPTLPRGNKAILAVVFDLHFRIGEGFDTNVLFDRAIPSSFGFGSALCNTDQYWFTANRYYFEVSRKSRFRLREIAYLCGIARAGAIDWDYIRQHAQAHSIEAPIYYISEILSSLNPALVPDDTRSNLEAMFLLSRDRALNDCGWQIGRLFGFVEPSPLAYLATSRELYNES